MVKGNMLKAILILLLISLTGLAHAEELSSDIPQILQAQKLIKSGKSKEAYALLQPFELEQAGNIRYDYLLGISALNSGKASQAVFALERVQESDPEYGDAGLWLAIAYFRSGDLERAKPGFNSVLSTSPNPESIARAKEYLASIRQLETLEAYRGESASDSGVRGKVEFGVGYDDNISNISSNNPGSTQLANTLSTPSSNLGSVEGILNFGIEGRTHMAGNYAFVSVDEGLRKYRSHSIMNSQTTIAKVGMNFMSENGHVSRINLARRQFRQEGFVETVKDVDNDYNINGVEGNSRFKLSEHDYLGILAQYNQLHFLKLSLEDTHQVMLGANFMHLFQTSGKPVFYLGYTNIEDKAVQTKPAYNLTYNNGLTVASRVSRNYFLYLQYSINASVDIFSANYVNFRRDTGAYARDPVIAFGEDKTRYTSLGLDWRPWSMWTVVAEVANTSNSSNLPQYSYRKTESRIILRREFNSM